MASWIKTSKTKLNFSLPIAWARKNVSLSLVCSKTYSVKRYHICFVLAVFVAKEFIVPLLTKLFTKVSLGEATVIWATRQSRPITLQSRNRESFHWFHSVMAPFVVVGLKRYLFDNIYVLYLRFLGRTKCLKATRPFVMMLLSPFRCSKKTPPIYGGEM